MINFDVAFYDRSHWGRISVTDSDRLNFLHNQTTNTFKLRKPGEGCDTVVLTSTARTIDLVTAYILDDSVLLLVSPEMNGKIISFLDRYIFFADKVKLEDITEQTATFSLLGAKSHEIVKSLGAENLINQPYGTHCEVKGIQIAVGNELAIEGYTLIGDKAIDLKQKLIDSGVTEIDHSTWENLRIEQGRPMPGSELTEDYNPLEAGLWHTISFNKGCYIGQETIARLDTYNGVKQQLWGIKLNQSVEPGAIVKLDDEKVGVMTSVSDSIGLAYIRTKAGGAGLTVDLGEVVDLPFLTHQKQS
ncbi:CAF17-like 4Fe-4S cluster assembly/insertion protein YgfZ [Leptolyngbya sp. NIES-2104]|uniref:CAF17-like 4Fe-4S cluster assembly/insertion protein YgfZ n=1 Tax=Leptolyngbya sp. NIES-2104 TaxID=1552121 RepID=UPI0006EC5B69|nr:folate-binding protein YgfZ [Leptolyngbya sp. NIES-2104]GAP96076.1 folate-dependent protein for Fe/S cluster synthesis/repair in oxidative stress [Leptolyngbya sp. NIES-2104]